jgi:hypothetical protein
MRRSVVGVLAVVLSGCMGMAKSAFHSPGAADASITNNQEAGVDEGAIVKAHGDHLIVLRRGRLFSIRVGLAEVVPVSRIDVTPPRGSKDTWYDEMLIHGNTVIVVGFSYGAGATELGMFDIDERGRLAHRSTYYMRSNDYYSSRNYAGRVVGDTLIFYMPYYYESGEERSLPAIRAYDAGSDQWTRIIRTIEHPMFGKQKNVLHTVVRCDLRRKNGLACTANGILGPYGRTFYVSPSAVYVWVSEEREAVAYRLPLDGTQPLAVRAAGTPIDQFSFKESADGNLDVLVRADGRGDAMWGPERGDGAVAHLRIPLASFARNPTVVPRERYRDLPKPDGHTVQNRFVGDYLLYGAGSGWGYNEKPTSVVYATPITGAGASATALMLPHGVDRIEAMGRDAVVIGSDGKSLHFTSLDLDGAAEPAIVDAYVQQGATQGELRSHGFFYKPDDEEPDEGILGLPVRGANQPGWAHLRRDSAAVVFLQVDRLKFRSLGALWAETPEVDDKCVASCVDWYGNARPIFYRGRIFALLGYELVEGAVQRAQIHTVRRTNFLNPLPKQSTIATTPVATAK